MTQKKCFCKSGPPRPWHRKTTRVTLTYVMRSALLIVEIRIVAVYNQHHEQCPEVLLRQNRPHDIMTLPAPQTMISGLQNCNEKVWRNVLVLAQLLLQIVNGRPFAARVEFVADKDQIALLNAP